MDNPSPFNPSATEVHLINPAYGDSFAFGKAGKDYTLIAQTFTMTVDCEIIQVFVKISTIKGNREPIHASLIRCRDGSYPSEDPDDILSSTEVSADLFPGAYPGFGFNRVAIMPEGLRVGAGDTLALVLKSNSPLDGRQMEYMVPEVAGENFNRGRLLQKIGDEAWRGVGGLRGYTGSADFAVLIRR